MNNSIFLHEDFYRQIELIPKQNYFFVTKTISTIQEVERSDEGFVRCKIRPEHLIKMASLGIRFDDLKRVLEPLSLGYVEEIDSGYGRSSYRLENTVAWAFERYGIFVDRHNDFVESIWICKSSKFLFSNSANLLSRALTLLANDFNLILVDWNREIVVDISKPINLNLYLVTVLRFNLVE